MNIAIIGAGFTGLSAAYYLSKKGHHVTVFEKEAIPGGLAVGYKKNNWNWTLEKHYHHWFTNDKQILSLAKELGQEVINKTPKTSIYLDKQIYHLDSPLALLQFSKLSLRERIQMGIVLGILRYNPFWKPLEKIKATKILPKAMGEKGWKMIWEPQLVNKMGNYANDVSLVWFWTRINKRTTSLAYPKKGFLSFANTLVAAIEKNHGRFLFSTEIIQLTSQGKPTVTYKQALSTAEQTVKFDAVIVTLPSAAFLKIATTLPDIYKQNLKKLQGIGATDLVLRLKKHFLPDNTYWLSICKKKSPVLVIVEHTNLLNKKYFNNEHIVYLGNYCKPYSKHFTMTKEQALQYYDPLLKQLNPSYKKHLIGYDLFKDPFAQPIVPVNYSQMIPPVKTPLPNVYLANMEQVYPWDRGTNYAVMLGKKVARLVDTTKTLMSFLKIFHIK